MGLLGKILGAKQAAGKATADAKLEIAKLGSKDAAEAMIAGCVLVAFADGECKDEELAKLEGILANNAALEPWRSDVNSLVNKYCATMKAGARSGKVQLLREIADVKGDNKTKEDVFLAMVDVAESDGTIDEKETELLKTIARNLGLSLADYGIAA